MASDVTRYQPVKLAAMEGLFESTHGCAARDHRHAGRHTMTLIDPIYVPDF